MLVQLRERGSAQNYLVLLPDRVTSQDGRRQRGLAGSEQGRDVLPVNFDIAMVHSCPRGDVAVAVEQREGLRRDNVAGIEQVGPVPPVERGMGDEGLQTAAEGESCHDHGHGKDGSQHCRTHWHRGSPLARFQREPHPDGTRCRYSHRDDRPSCLRGAGWIRLGPDSDPMRHFPVGENCCHRADPADQHH